MNSVDCTEKLEYQYSGIPTIMKNSKKRMNSLSNPGVQQSIVLWVKAGYKTLLSQSKEGLIERTLNNSLEMTALPAFFDTYWLLKTG